jgi:4-diphosphocytidyl-2-C-methyl-D-erythritol kinase
MASLSLRAFAKINLSLRVKEGRSDGFHEVQSFLQAIDLFDRLKIETRSGPFEIQCSVPGVPAGRTNLVWRAAQRLWDAAGRTGEMHDVLMRLEKNIPLQAGLGGGSSDAAAALLGLRRIWKLRLRDEQLHEIATELGSDVPYFLMGGTALALGRGDELYPLQDLPQYWVVLVIPPFGVATKDAYGWFDQNRERAAHQRTQTGSLAPLLYVTLANDLEQPVIDRHPLIGELKQRLRDLGAAIAAMSGSGSAVFGVFTAEASARAALRAMKKTAARVLLARFLRRRSA